MCAIVRWYIKKYSEKLRQAWDIICEQTNEMRKTYIPFEIDTLFSDSVVPLEYSET